MRYLLATVTGAAALAAVGLAPGLAAGSEHGPPLLTPTVAAQIAVACPAAGAYAAALVRGATRDEAAAAEPVLAACRAQVRLPSLRWKTDVAMLGLAAAQLTRGLLDRNAGELRSAVDQTNDLRALTIASDDEVRAWRIIPDYIDTVDRKAVIVDDDASFCAGSAPLNAAYINLAARAGGTWIDTPRSTAVVSVARLSTACAVSYARLYPSASPVAEHGNQYDPARRPKEIDDLTGTTKAPQ